MPRTRRRAAVKELVVVRFGPPAAGEGAQPPERVGEEISIGDLSGPAALEVVARRRPLLWLPPWVRLGADEWGAVADWIEGGSQAGARVRLRLAGEGFAAPLGAMLVLTRPGAGTLRGGRPVLSRGRVATLPGTWTLVPPATLSEHLQELNRQTTAAARASEESPRPKGIDLLRPLAKVARGLLRHDGSFRRTLPRVLLEGYRDTLLAAKLWERGCGVPVRETAE